ncbi:MAG: class I SAM-dependent methyltransferase [Sandaracinaceae bacterium]
MAHEEDVRAALREGARQLPELYRDPIRYDVLAQMTAPDDLPFYRALVREHPGPVLELGAGTGRVAIELAADGTDVTGVELLEPMIELAAQKAQARGVELTLALGDLRSFRLERTFALVLLPYNTLNHLTDEDDLERALASIRTHMDGASRLVIDTFQPSLAFLGADRTTPKPILRYRDPYSEQEILIAEENHYDSAKQINRVVWRETIAEVPDARVDELRMRIFFPRELDALLTLSGFAIEHKHGDYDRRAFDAASPKQLLVCRLAD